MTIGRLGDRRSRALGHVALGRRGIFLSSAVTRYQLGLVFHAASVTAPFRASTPHGHIRRSHEILVARDAKRPPKTRSSPTTLSDHARPVQSAECRRLIKLMRAPY
jgi:hypothetical protein